MSSEHIGESLPNLVVKISAKEKHLADQAWKCIFGADSIVVREEIDDTERHKDSEDQVAFDGKIPDAMPKIWNEPCATLTNADVSFRSSSEQGDKISIRQTFNDLIERIDDASNQMDFDPESLARKNQKLIFGADEDNDEDFHLYLSESDDDDEKKDSNLEKNQTQVASNKLESLTSSEQEVHDTFSKGDEKLSEETPQPSSSVEKASSSVEKASSSVEKASSSVEKASSSVEKASASAQNTSPPKKRGRKRKEERSPPLAQPEGDDVTVESEEATPTKYKMRPRKRISMKIPDSDESEIDNYEVDLSQMAKKTIAPSKKEQTSDGIGTKPVDPSENISGKTDSDPPVIDDEDVRLSARKSKGKRSNEKTTSTGLMSTTNKFQIRSLKFGEFEVEKEGGGVARSDEDLGAKALPVSKTSTTPKKLNDSPVGCSKFRCTSEEVEEPESVQFEIRFSPCSSPKDVDVIGYLPATIELPKSPDPDPDLISAEMFGESIISVDIIENPDEIVILPSSTTNSQNFVEESIPDNSNGNQATKVSKSLTSSSSSAPSSALPIIVVDDEDDEVTFSKLDNRGGGGGKSETDRPIPAFLTSLPKRSRVRSSERNCSIPVVNCSTPVVSLMKLGRKTVVSADPLKCPDCDFMTRSAPTMIRHTIEEHGIRTFSCTQCEFSATSAISIMEHNHANHRVQDSPKLVTCSKCSFTAPEMVDIASHFKQAHMTSEN